jgi:hypothetical protein
MVEDWRKCIYIIIKWVLCLPVPVLAFVLIVLGSTVEERDFLNDFEKIKGGCRIVRSNFTSFQEERIEAGSSTICTCTVYYKFLFTTVSMEGSNSTVYNSIEVPHDVRGGCGVRCTSDDVPPKWDDGQIVECCEPNFNILDDNPPPQYSCGNSKCIRIYWDRSALHRANAMFISGVCFGCIGFISWVVLCCLLPLRERRRRRRL